MTNSNFVGACTGRSGRGLAFQDAVDIGRGTAKDLLRVRSVGHQRAAVGELPVNRKRGQAVSGDQLQDGVAVDEVEGVGADDQAAAGIARERGNRRLEPSGGGHGSCRNLQPAGGAADSNERSKVV